MVQKIETKWTGTRVCLFSGEADSLKELVEQAVRSGVDLMMADLVSANLSSADLTDAGLSGVKLNGAILDESVSDQLKRSRGNE